jgi:hypothetical protein
MDSNATPIQPNQLKVIRERGGAIRDAIFDAQSVIDVAAGACLSEVNVDPYNMRRVLALASKLLGKAGSDADAICMEIENEVSHGDH